MTVCNMSIEAGARAGLIAPDEKTFAYLEGRPNAPKGGAWEQAVAWWRRLPTDEGAHYDTRGRSAGRRHRAAGHLGHQPAGRAADHRRVPDPANAPDENAARPWRARWNIWA